MTAHIIEIAAMLVYSANTAALFYYLRRSRVAAPPPADPCGTEGAGQPGFPRPDRQEVAVIAPDNRTGRQYLADCKYTGHARICTQREHLQGQTFPGGIVFLDWGWEHKRATRGQLAMAAEQTGTPVNYIAGGY